MPDAPIPHGPLWRRLRPQPRLSDPERAAARLGELAASPEAAPLRALVDRPKVRAMLAALADHSPYLWHLAASDPERLARLLDTDPRTRLGALVADLRGARDETEAALMRRLRLAKQELALLVALVDLGGVWSLDEVLRALSKAADVLVATAVDHLLRQAVKARKLRLRDIDEPSRGSGLTILGLGKLGGLELNYSSDIDLIVVFDPDAPSIVRPDEAKPFYVRLTQDLVRVLQQATAEGYVFRVDLRLRPDPGSTAVAIALDAAYLYYESFGQNWERAAMIKARPIAGDLALGRRFLDGLSPFVWRRYFDYASIADIHAMKRQIHRVKGHAEITVLGHDLKLGRGGIREIEFFVQTQQLVFGGKQPELRNSRTLEALRQLRLNGWIGAHADEELARAYEFLRQTEHRLQMIADEQTQKLPRTQDELEAFARFCGVASASRFSSVLTKHLRAVAYHYALLFESAPGLDERVGSLVFTGVSDDPETIETLTTLGYKSPTTIIRLVREWHSGRRPAVNSARARETLTDLVPKLLMTFSRVYDPDAAVAAFDEALYRIRAGSELFAMLNGNAALRSLFGDILGSAPILAAAVTLRPHLLDGIIGGSAGIEFDEARMEARVEELVAANPTTEAFLDAVRDFFHEEHFLIGVAVLSGDLDVDRAGEAYGALAVGIIRAALRQLRSIFAADFGHLPGAEVVVVAMGKLGSREMTATSDLDLVLLYTFDPDAAYSDGAKSLYATQYFTRLTQRLMTHLTTATRRGKLYEVDMRLRPSGQQGPLATQFSAFCAYQQTEAATWEQMALTRARVIAGDAGLGDRVSREITSVLHRPPKAMLRTDVAEMRALIEKEKPPRDAWDLKLIPGGLTDIEFIAQYLVLHYAGETEEPPGTATVEILAWAGRHDRLPRQDVEKLVEAHRLYSRAVQIMRLALDGDQTPDGAGSAVRRRLAMATNAPDFARLVDDVATARQAVRDIFRTVFSAG